MADINIPAVVIRVSGLPGLKGPKGDSGIYEQVSAIPMEVGKLVALTSAGLVLADAASGTGTIGFTKTASAANTIATVTTDGLIGEFLGLNKGDPVYMANAGNITQTKPTVGYVQVVGIAASTSEIYVQIQPAEIIPAPVIPEDVPIKLSNKIAAYTLTASDVGYVISITEGGVIIPVDILEPLDEVIIINNSDLSQVIACPDITAYNAGVAGAVTQVTLAARGRCSVLCFGINTLVLSGNIA